MRALIDFFAVLALMVASLLLVPIVLLALIVSGLSIGCCLVTRNRVLVPKLANTVNRLETTKMDSLTFRCPRTANVLTSGIVTDSSIRLKKLGSYARIWCRHCKTIHVLPVSSAGYEPDNPRHDRVGSSTRIAGETNG